jgi:dihydropteroate synthase
MLKCGDRQLLFGTRTFIMGILNVTPDSFSDSGCFLSISAALKQAELMLRYGADVIDIGGESTRPFSSPVSPEEEQERVLPVIRALISEGINNLSIDTRNSSTAKSSLEEGVSWVNDVSAFSYDEKMWKAAKHADVVVLMHSRATPQEMQKGNIVYDNVVIDIVDYLENRVRYAVEKGFSSQCLLVDPGIGFGKKLSHNLELIKNLNHFQGIGAGVLCGPSRKAFIGELTGIAEASDRDNATLGALSWAVRAGADMVRVHNVKSTSEMLKVVDALKYGGEKDEDLHETW